MEFSLNDYVNLESTVLLALSRLQTLEKCSKKLKKSTGVACKDVVEFLKTNYSWVDGDVESQVMTALLACVKTGLVCVLNNHKYLLLGSNPNNMISHCVTRITHGPKCCCSRTLECLYKTPRSCCTIESSGIIVKRTKKTRKKKKEAKPTTSPKKIPKKKRKIETKKPKNCALTAQKFIGTSKSAILLGKTMMEPKCNYCMEFHSSPKMKRLCTSCFPSGKLNAIPEDSFSPRDELKLVSAEKFS